MENTKDNRSFKDYLNKFKDILHKIIHKFLSIWNYIWNNRWYPLLILGIIFTIVFIIEVSYTANKGGFLHMNSDDIVQYYPYVEAFFNKIKNGTLSVYDTDLFGGASYFSASYYVPFDIFTFLAFLLSYVMPGETAYAISNFGRVMAGALLLYYVFSRKFSFKTAFVCGLIAFIGGTTESYYIFPVYLGICFYAPLAMLCVDLVVEKKGLYYLVLPLYSFIVILYDFYIAYMLLAFICIYFVVKLHTENSFSFIGKNCFLFNKEFWITFLEFMAFLLLGVVMGAIILLPAALYIMHDTSRNSSLSTAEIFYQFFHNDKSKESYLYFSKYSDGIYHFSWRHYFTQWMNLFTPNDPHSLCLVSAGDYVREHASLYITCGGSIYLAYFFVLKGKRNNRLKFWVLFFNILLCIPLFCVIFGLNSSPYVRWFFIPYFLNLYASAIAMNEHDFALGKSIKAKILPMILLCLELGSVIYVLVANPDIFIHYSAPDELFYFIVIPSLVAIDLYILILLLSVILKREKIYSRCVPFFILLEFVFGAIAIFSNVDNTSSRYYSAKNSSVKFKNDLISLYDYDSTDGYRINMYTIYGREITNENILIGQTNFGRFFQSFYNPELNVALSDIYSESSTSWTRTFNNGYELITGPVFNVKYIIANENVSFPEEFYEKKTMDNCSFYEVKEDIPFIVYDKGSTDLIAVDTFGKQASALYYAYLPDNADTGLEMVESADIQSRLRSYYSSKSLSYLKTISKTASSTKYFVYDLEQLTSLKDATYIYMSNVKQRKLTHEFMYLVNELPENCNFYGETQLHFATSYTDMSQYKYLVVEAATDNNITSAKAYSYSYDLYRDFITEQSQYQNRSFSLNKNVMHITCTMPDDSKTRIIKTGYSYSDDWILEAEGMKTVNVDGGFLGILVDDGITDVDITLTFSPEGYETGKKLSYSGIALYEAIVIIMTYFFLTKRRKKNILSAMSYGKTDKASLYKKNETEIKLMKKENEPGFGHQSKKDIIMEILRFLVVGGLATICDYIVFYLFKLVVFQNTDNKWLLAVATALGFITGLFVNWFLQKFVYKYISKDQTKSKVVFLKFVILSVIGLGITELGILLAQPLYKKVYWHIIVDFDFWQLFFKCLMTGIVLIFNYIGRKLFVFKEKKNPEKPVESTNEKEPDALPLEENKEEISNEVKENE